MQQIGMSPGDRFSASVLNNLAVSSHESGRMEEAQDFLHDALSADPLHPEATFNLAMMAWSGGSITDFDAVERMRRSVANHPGSWVSQYLLGIMHKHRRDLEAAKAAYAEAARLAPDEPSPREALASLESKSQGWPKPLRTILAHPQRIYTVTFSSDGRLLATSGGDEKTCVWNVSTGELLRVFEKSSSGTMAFLPNAQSILIPALGDLNHWRLDDGALIRKYPSKFSLGIRVGGWIAYTALLPDGREVLTITSDGEVRLLDLETGKTRTVVEPRQRGLCECAALSPDGKCVVIGSSITQGGALFLDLSSGNMSALPVHTGGISSVAITAEYVLTGSYDGTACLWDRRTGSIARTFKRWVPHTDPAVFTQAGKYALSESHPDGAHIWDLSSGKDIRSLDRADHYDPYAFFPDARQRLALENEISMNMPTPKRAEDSVTSVALAPDGRFAATGAYGGKAFLWDIGTGQCLRTFDGFPREVKCLSFTPDSKSLLIAGYGAEYEDKSIIQIWDVDAFKPISFNPVVAPPAGDVGTTSGTDVHGAVGAQGAASTLVMSGQALAQRVEDSVRRRNWEDARFLLRQGQALPGYERHPLILRHLLRADYFSRHPSLPFRRVLKGHTDKVNSVGVSPDGRLALSASDDGTARVWDLSTMSQTVGLQTQGRAVRSASFSSDGRQAITLEDDCAARIYDAGSGRCLQTFVGLHSQASAVTLSRKGQHPAAGNGNEVVVWDLRRGERRSLPHPEHVISVAFSGDHLLTATQDGGLFRWRYERGQFERRLFFGPARSAAVFSGAYLDHSVPLALTCALDGTARLWNLDTNTCVGIARDHFGKAVSASAVTCGDSAPVKFIVTACDNGFAYLWSLESGRCEREVPNRQRSAKVVAYSPKMRVVLTAGPDSEVQVWSMK